MRSVSAARTVVRPLLTGFSTGLNALSYMKQHRRFFSEYQIGMFKRLPYTIFGKEEAEKAVDSLFAVLGKTDLVRYHEQRLRVVTVSEFTFNHHRVAVPVEGLDEGTGLKSEERHNAGAPLKWEAWQAIIQRTLYHMSKLDPGLLLVIGGTAVDTGEKVEGGLIRGANLGVVFESGTPADFIMYTKFHHDPIDGWDLEKYSLVPADGEIGPLTLKVKDPSGGKSRIITFLTCADMVKGPFPKDMVNSKMVLCSSYGTPKNWQLTWVEDNNISEYAVVAVNDSSLADLNLGSGPTGVFEYGKRPKHPWLASMHSVAGWAGFADWALAAYETLLRVPPSEALAKELGFNRIETETQTTDGLRLVITPVRRFGPDK